MNTIKIVTHVLSALALYVARNGSTTRPPPSRVGAVCVIGGAGGCGILPAHSISVLTYDAESRLTKVSGATSASFTYDGDGKRVKSVMGGVTTYNVANYFAWTGSTTSMVKYYYAGNQRSLS